MIPSVRAASPAERKMKFFVRQHLPVYLALDFLAHWLSLSGRQPGGWVWNLHPQGTCWSLLDG